MQLKLIPTLAFLLAFLTPPSLATVALGTITFETSDSSTTWNAAWIEGDDPCGSAVNINLNGENPCGIEFTLSNGYTYYLENCGDGSFALYNSDGSYNHLCEYTGDDINGYCGIHREWDC
ncbi:hypothetical protein VTN77DRAFT_9238 [Rasamsonia byssochlamydoides]|uniref:uncharacterized protein n=1 Tax=Rasamsonia byssochlamydoides TaxID=89139 RepID=UPI0037439666